MVERLNPEYLASSTGDVAAYIESDFKIRSGLCPNNCGLMTTNIYGQECPACKFSCNTHAELTKQ